MTSQDAVFAAPAGSSTVLGLGAPPGLGIEPVRPSEAALDPLSAGSGAAAYPAPTNGSEEVEPEWTQVYQDFVRIKQDCGEAVDGFTFERFTQTLRKNRDTLMREHGVQHVQFSAYVKAGRAALKAKPVRQ
jgi:hypothetical protein